jgi:hypothetical protein
MQIKPLLLTLLALPLITGGPAFAAELSKGEMQEIIKPTPLATGDTTEPVVDILPAKSVSGEALYTPDDIETHPAIHLTPDKSTIIRLDVEAGTIIVGNPAHLSVMADNAKTLVLIPRLPGATYFTVMDRHGKTVMQRHVIVDGPKDKYVRIRKSCAGTKNCQPTQVYYCPDMCHEINIPTGGQSTGSNVSAEDMAKSPQKPEDGPAEQGTTENGEETSESSE